MCLVFWILYAKRTFFIFWFSIFPVLYVSCTLIGIFFFRLGKFCSVILLKIYFVFLTWVSSPSSIPIIHRFGLFIVPQISWVFCAWISLNFKFSLTGYPFLFFYLVFNVWDSSISCILWLEGLEASQGMLRELEADAKGWGVRGCWRKSEWSAEMGAHCFVL